MQFIVSLSLKHTCRQNLVQHLEYFFNKSGHCEDFPFWSVHGSLLLYLRNDIILFLHPYGLYNPRPRLSHQFSLCITPHRGGASALIKAASDSLCFLADVCVRIVVHVMTIRSN